MLIKKECIDKQLLVLCLLLLPMIPLSECFADNVRDEKPLSTIAGLLPGAPLKKLPAIVDQLVECCADQVKPVLQAMLAGKLFYRLSDKKLFEIVRELPDAYVIRDPFMPMHTETVAKADIKKIRTSNKVRSVLRQSIARLDLHAEQADIRLAAVKSILQKLTADDVSLLVSMHERETDKRVLALIDTASALGKLTDRDQLIKLQALASLSGNLNPVVKTQVSKLLQKDAQGQYLESDAMVRAGAEKTLHTIAEKTQFYQFIETLFFGISLGSVLLLAASGLAITFGVMGVINMAHGELMMIGAYTTYVVQQLMGDMIEWSILVALPAAFIVCAIIGLGIERTVIQFLRGRVLETLLATFGVSLILQQAVRTVFSPLNRQVETPEWMSGSLEINAVLSLTYNRMYIILLALLVFAAIQMIFKRTSVGLLVRAVSQDRNMANALGVKSYAIDAMTFALGSGIAGVAGVALSQLTNVGPNLGQAYIIDSFMVVVFGGVGNLWGTLIGSLSLGVINKFLEPVTGTVLAKIIVLVVIILFIQKRPQGLFAPKGRSAE